MKVHLGGTGVIPSLGYLGTVWDPLEAVSHDVPSVASVEDKT